MSSSKQPHLILKALTIAIATAITSHAHAATFDGHIENGTFDQANGTSNTFINNLTVNGNWNLNSIGNNTNMFFSGAQTVNGSGFINLSDRAQNRIYSSGNNLLTIGSLLTIRGAGQLGIGQTHFNNFGSILAQGSNTLTITSSGFTNNGTLRAEGNGGLVISGTTLTNNTSVDVNAGSKLAITASTVNGVFNNNGGSMTSSSSTFNSAAINGAMTQVNGANNTFLNGLTVNGSWNMNSIGNNTNMFFNGAQTIGGTGEIIMSDRAQNRLYSTANNLLTIGSNLTIRGAGQIGIGQTHFNNFGSILAQGSNTLTIASSGFTNNGTLRAEGSGGLVISGTALTNNTSVDVNAGSKLHITSSTVNGVFNNNGGTMTSTNSTFNSAAINGAMTQANGTSNTFLNGLTVNGSWNLSSIGNNTNMFFNGAQTIGGTGEIVMSDRAQNRLYSTANSLLTIGSGMTIRGAGQIGINQTTFDNQGSILAQGSNTLTIQSNSFTNNGTLRAEGTGGLVITGTNLDNNTSVDVNADSKLLIISSTVNGVFNNTAGGSMNAETSTFDAATINGVMSQANGRTNTFKNGLTVNGSWNLNSIGNNTDMFFNGAQTIDGTGDIVMSNRTQNRLYSNANNLLTIGSDMTIRGAGQIGINQTTFDNQGSILAQGSNTLTIQSSSFTNNGTLRAEGTGGLIITGTNLDNNTSVDVNTDSKLLITSSTVNGIFNNTAGGSMNAETSTFDAATINGVMSQANGRTNTFKNGLTVNGSWNLNSIGNNTDMFFNGSQTISGSGEIVMSNRIQNRIYGTNNSTITLDTNTAIRGAGQIGINRAQLVNKGTITADQANSLTISMGGTGLDNQGNLNASGTGGINITGGFTNSGNVEIAANSKINRTGTYVQTAGLTNVDGTLNSTGIVDIQGGRLSGSGTINGDVNNAGIVMPGGDNSAGLLTINGDFTQSLSGVLDIDLAGLLAGNEYDVLDINGTANLDGALDVSFINSFNPLVGATFDILSADVITGTFASLNLTPESGYTWQIDYLVDFIGTTDIVRLTVLTSAVPVPGAVWLFGSGLLGLIGFARRKRNS